MIVIIKFDDDEIRQYSGSKTEILAQAKKRCDKMETDIVSIMPCDGHSFEDE